MGLTNDTVDASSEDDDSIREAAIDVALRIGPAVQLRDVSESVFLSKSGLYRHIAGIDSVRDAAARRAQQHLDAACTADTSQLGSALANRGLGVARYLLLPDNHRDLHTRFAARLSCEPRIAAAATCGITHAARRTETNEEWAEQAPGLLHAVINWANGRTNDTPTPKPDEPVAVRYPTKRAIDRLALRTIRIIDSGKPLTMRALIADMRKGNSAVYRHAQNEQELRGVVERYLADISIQSVGSPLEALTVYAALRDEHDAVYRWIEERPGSATALDRTVGAHLFGSDFDERSDIVASALLVGAGSVLLASKSRDASALAELALAMAETQ